MQKEVTYGFRFESITEKARGAVLICFKMGSGFPKVLRDKLPDGVYNILAGGYQGHLVHRMSGPGCRRVA